MVLVLTNIIIFYHGKKCSNRSSISFFKTWDLFINAIYLFSSFFLFFPIPLSHLLLHIALNLASTLRKHWSGPQPSPPTTALATSPRSQFAVAYLCSIDPDLHPLALILEPRAQHLMLSHASQVGGALGVVDLRKRLLISSLDVYPVVIVPGQVPLWGMTGSNTEGRHNTMS